MTNKRIKNIAVGNAAEGNIATVSTDQDKNKLSRTVTIRLSVTIRNQPSYAGKKISRVIREIFCNNKAASA